MSLRYEKGLVGSGASESRKGKGELSVSGWRSAEESKHVLRGQVVFRRSKKNRWGIQSTADKGVWSRG